MIYFYFRKQIQDSWKRSAVKPGATDEITNRDVIKPAVNDE